MAPSCRKHKGGLLKRQGKKLGLLGVLALLLATLGWQHHSGSKRLQQLQRELNDAINERQRLQRTLNDRWARLLVRRRRSAQAAGERLRAAAARRRFGGACR